MTAHAYALMDGVEQVATRLQACLTWNLPVTHLQHVSGTRRATGMADARERKACVNALRAGQARGAMSV